MTKCILCGHAVGKGNQHAKGQCPPQRGHTGGHHKSKAALRRKRNADLPQRGVTVAGTGVPKGAAKG